MSTIRWCEFNLPFDGVIGRCLEGEDNVNEKEKRKKKRFVDLSYNGGCESINPLNNKL